MSAVCPLGHDSNAGDYCDVCGAPIEAGAESGDMPAATPPDADGQPCPNCETPNAVDALFCENCGYDFTTGALPRPEEASADAGADPSAASPETDAPGSAAPDGGSSDPSDEGTAWVAEVWIDPAWYQEQQSPDPLPSPGLPVVVPLSGRSVLVGRTSHSRNIHPDIDCEIDSGVSRRQCQLSTDGRRWWVEDLDSANGTFVGPAAGALPDNPLAVGTKRELASDDRIYVGAWTRIVIRAATEDERG